MKMQRGRRRRMFVMKNEVKMKELGGVMKQPRPKKIWGLTEERSLDLKTCKPSPQSVSCIWFLLLCLPSVTLQSVQDMDPADMNQVEVALSAQSKKILLHEAQLNKISSSVKELTERQAGLQSSVATQVNPLSAQLQLVIAHLGGNASPQQATAEPEQPSTPPRRDLPTWPCQRDTPGNPVSHLTGKAAALATAVCQDVKLFSQTLTRMFDHSSPAREASRALRGLRQGSRRVIDYAMQFRTLVAYSGWNVRAIKDAFINGLNEGIKDQLAPHDSPVEFEDLVDVSPVEGGGALPGQQEDLRTTALQDLQFLPQPWIERRLQTERIQCCWAEPKWLQRNTNAASRRGRVFTVASQVIVWAAAC
ncbi:hypothetical protein L3Q82_016615 [Scortum barcoo]|uniref:Uncharacterized protein n=1 Tax=Scortum barcoo TaxID=214431 RepID=A0ACB8X8L1_9TELE|nr:hypothetical protein L3Q82_016615 [Scortum barcoo]